MLVDTEILWQQLKTIFDPDLHINIVDLGLIYSITATNEEIKVVMTLTSPFCPMADFLLEEVKNKIMLLVSNVNVNVELTWDPAWTKDMITEEGKMELGML